MNFLFKRFDRYCYTEFLTLLAAGTTLPAGLLLFTEEMKRMMEWVRLYGCPIDTFLLMIALQIPEIVVRCMPGGVMIGVMLTLYKMMADRELVALQTSGISMGRIFRPFLVIAFSAALLSLWINEFAVPACLKSSVNLTILAANNLDIPVTRGVNDYKGTSVDAKGNTVQIFLVASRKGPELTNTALFNIADKNNIQITFAPRGILKSEDWQLFDGHVYNMCEDPVVAMQSSHFEKMHIKPPDRSKYMYENRDPFTFELNTWELYQYMNKLRAQGKTVTAKMKLDLIRRFTDPFASYFVAMSCLPLVLLTRTRRVAFSLGYGGAILVSYFTLRAITGGLAENGALTPELAAWLPCIAVATMCGAFVLIVKKGLN